MKMRLSKEFLKNVLLNLIQNFTKLVFSIY